MLDFTDAVSYKEAVKAWKLEYAELTASIKQQKLIYKDVQRAFSKLDTDSNLFSPEYRSANMAVYHARTDLNLLKQKARQLLDDRAVGKLKAHKQYLVTRKVNLT